MFEINGSTKIATVLKHRPQALEALVAITPKFEKLRNPLLRKLMAGRTSLSEAAKIGKCDIKRIADALKPFGFEFIEVEPAVTVSGTTEPEPSGSFARELDKLPKKILDVREDLAAGKDPLKMIMSVMKELPSGYVLQLINTFEPTPLIRLLKNKGYDNCVVHVSADEVHTFFRQGSTEKQAIETDAPELVSLETFTGKMNSFGEKITSVDVSELEMPMPMVTILESLESLEEGFALSVQHKRIPVFLFNELKERDFSYLVHRAGDTDVRLLIWKKL